jgi:hypothetical protein
MLTLCLITLQCKNVTSYIAKNKTEGECPTYLQTCTKEICLSAHTNTLENNHERSLSSSQFPIQLIPFTHTFSHTFGNPVLLFHPSPLMDAHQHIYQRIHLNTHNHHYWCDSHVVSIHLTCTQYHYHTQQSVQSNKVPTKTATSVAQQQQNSEIQSLHLKATKCHKMAQNIMWTLTHFYTNNTIDSQLSSVMCKWHTQLDCVGISTEAPTANRKTKGDVSWSPHKMSCLSISFFDTWYMNMAQNAIFGNKMKVYSYSNQVCNLFSKDMLSPTHMAENELLQ